MKISPARAAAFDILLRIETEQAFSSVLLPGYEDKLPERDRGLCHEITLGTLRQQMYLDRVIDHLTKGRKLDPDVRVALRIGLYQVIFLDRIPQYSAINESVNLVQRAKKSSAKAFVNAVLRGYTRSPISLEFSDEVDRFSVETSHPKWLLEKWIAYFGLDATKDLAAKNNAPAPLAFRFTADEGRDLAGTRIEKSIYVDACLIAETATPELLSAATNGEIYFQDEGSQLVGSAVKIRRGARFLDVCAAPGSKTTQVALRAQNTAGLLAAGDVHWPRVEFLRENCRRQGAGEVNVLQYDAESSLPFAENSFDVVLVDAPCSGTGTIRSNPEIRYFFKPEDLAELSSKQLRILKNASKLVRPGGTLIYSTCSLEREENEEVAQWFLKENDGFRVARPEVTDRFITPEGFARTFPHRDGLDGFFIATFERLR
jgi:16S rRNA (cytosine967-C5)-methyltransferase